MNKDVTRQGAAVGGKGSWASPAHPFGHSDRVVATHRSSPPSRARCPARFHPQAPLPTLRPFWGMGPPSGDGPCTPRGLCPGVPAPKTWSGRPLPLLEVQLHPTLAFQAPPAPSPPSPPASATLGALVISSSSGLCSQPPPDRLTSVPPSTRQLLKGSCPQTTHRPLQATRAPHIGLLK